MLRNKFVEQIKEACQVHPMVALLGPRQCGKTTLSSQYAAICRQREIAVTVFDLEHALDLSRLENPMLALGSFKGLVIIDEIQNRPDLFPTLRVFIDQNKAT